MAESFFATFKTEFFYRRVWPTKSGASRVGAWIEDRYNRRRAALGDRPDQPRGLRDATLQPERGRSTSRITPCPPSGVRANRNRQRNQQSASGEWDPAGFVFASPYGDPIDPRRDLDEWKALLREADVRESRLHDARHTAATFLLLQGVDARVVMDLMGWSTVSMLRRYQHVIDTLRRDAAARMGGLLYGAPANETAELRSE